MGSEGDGTEASLTEDDDLCMVSVMAYGARLLMLAVVIVVLGSAGCGGSGRDPLSPRLRTVGAEAIRARALLLISDDLSPTFGTFDTRASPSNNQGSCGDVAGPDLTKLTETAEVYGDGIINGDEGAYYFPSAYVFVSAAQAARAQALSVGPADSKCLVEIVRDRLKPLLAWARKHGKPAGYTGRSDSAFSRKIDGVTVRGQQVILNATAELKVRESAYDIFFRRGRALAEVWSIGVWDASGPRIRNKIVAAEVRHLNRHRF